MEARKKDETGENETFAKMRLQNRMCNSSCEGKRSLSKGKGQKTTRELKLDWSLKISAVKKNLFLIAFSHGFSSTHF